MVKIVIVNPNLTRDEINLLHEMSSFCCQNNMKFMNWMKKRGDKFAMQAIETHKRLLLDNNGHSLIGKLYKLDKEK